MVAACHNKVDKDPVYIAQSSLYDYCEYAFFTLLAINFKVRLTYAVFMAPLSASYINR